MKKQLSVCLHSTSHNEEDEGKERVVAAVQQMGSMAGVSPTFSSEGDYFVSFVCEFS